MLNLNPGDQIGPYTLVKFLGEGTFGEVWLSEKAGSLVSPKAPLKSALKIPMKRNDMSIEKVKHEARLMAMASGHPNIVSITDADVYDNVFVLAMDYIADGSLGDLLKRRADGKLDLEEAITVTIGILEGLSHLHERGIIHRDLKPENILMQTMFPKITDFGLSRYLESTNPTRTAQGTPHYMAPEVWNEGARSNETDIWAVGTILYRMIVGDFPYSSINDDDGRVVAYKIVTSDYKEPSMQTPAHLRGILSRSLQRDPNNRIGSAAKMRKELERSRLIVQSGIGLKRLSTEDRGIVITKIAQDVDGGSGTFIPAGRLTRFQRRSLQNHQLLSQQDVLGIIDVRGWFLGILNDKYVAFTNHGILFHDQGGVAELTQGEKFVTYEDVVSSEISIKPAEDPSGEGTWRIIQLGELGLMSVPRQRKAMLIYSILVRLQSQFKEF